MPRSGNFVIIALILASSVLSLMMTLTVQAQDFEVIHSFTVENDGLNPNAGVMIADAEGNLYGTTADGGAYGYGAVYEVPANGGDETVLYSFRGGTDGANPTGPLLRDITGNLYGVAEFGGSFDGPCLFTSVGCGVVFRLTPAGKEKVLYTFTGGADGSAPMAGLINDSAGNLYGTTFYGGLGGGCGGSGCGVIFKLSPPGNESVLHTFAGPPDGQFPSAPLLRDGSGNFYGTTTGGGISDLGCAGAGCGVVFKLDSSENETLLYSFTGGADGGFPIGGALVMDSKQNLDGTAQLGGDTSCGYSTGCGVVFEVASAGNQIVLYTFMNRSDGAQPAGGLIRDAKGNLFGTTFDGGRGAGVVFELTTSGSERSLHIFDSADGASPVGTLLPYQGSFYGVTEYGGGGVFSGGEVFRFGP
jgi:uncharacterized repeat protein (TIGR03803 family)